jgi:CheY-like chemotaxis protein
MKGGSMKQVLVVDDDPAMRKLLRDILGEDYDVSCVENGREALDALRECAPDAVLLDMMMPVMDGRSFLLAYHNQPDPDQPPVMVVSADPKACEDGRKLGAQACVGKPFDIDWLLNEIEGLLTHRDR